MPLKLAGLLVTSGMVPSSAIDDALRRQVLAGGTLDTALLEAGIAIPEIALLRALERASGLPGIDASGLLNTSEQAARLLPAKLAVRHCLLPLALHDRSLDVAVSFPVNAAMLDEIGFLLGRDLRPHVAIESRLREALARVYQVPLPARHVPIVALLGPSTPLDPVTRSQPSLASLALPARDVTEAAPEPAAATMTATATESAAAPSAPEPSDPPADAALPDAEPRAESGEEGAPGESREATGEPGVPGRADDESTDIDFDDEDDEASDQDPQAHAEDHQPPALTLRKDDDGLASALARALELNLEPLPIPAPRAGRPAPRDRVEVQGIARRIVAISGGVPGPDSEPATSWTLGRAKASLEQAHDRHEIIAVALRFALKTFDFAAALAVVGGNAVGWTALTRTGNADDQVERVSLPLDAPSVLRTVLLTRGRYLGPLPEDTLSQSLLADMGRARPTTAFLYPVEVRDRPVVILYGDVHGRPASDKLVAEFVVFAQDLGRRFERLILDQKRRMASQTPPEPPPPPAPAVEPATEPARAPAEASFRFDPPMLSSAELFLRGPARPHASRPVSVDRSPNTLLPAPAPGVSRFAVGRSEAQAPMAMDELFAAADRLVGTDLAERARALAALSRYPDVASAVLVTRFPGPVLRARLPVTELPSPEELGPVPAALARLGAPAARALVPLIEQRDVDTRYFALLTAGRMPGAVLLGPVLQRVFDRHPVVASAARAALVAMRGVDGWPEALAKIRASLDARDPDNVANALRALGALHEVDAVDRIIELVGHENKIVALAASESLREICKQALGMNQARWAAWWAEKRNRPRTEWLIEALRHRDLDLRIAAFDELVRACGDSFGYYPDGPRLEREAAVKRWESWWQDSERARATGT